MLNFSQKKYLSLLVLFSLSLSSFANTAQDVKVGLSKKSAPNLVELYKVKAHATEHIRGIEAKLSATEEADQEELLVELAQSLLYYQDRHNKASDTKAVTSKAVNSLSTNEANGGVSLVVNPKGSYSANNIYRKALNAYKKASKLSLNKNRIKYTRKLSELAVKLQKKNELVQVFDELLQHSGDETGTYLAQVDYADGLAKFKDDAAERQFLSAVNMRSPVDGVEANFRYANYLLDNGKPREALNVLEKFTFEERRMYVHIALLRQKIIHNLKLNTREVDAEIKQIRKNLSENPLVGAIPKFIDRVTEYPTNMLDLPKAYAFGFSHNNERDDSRGGHHDSLVYNSVFGYRFSTQLTNLAEVIYNESRGHGQITRHAVAWAIRNRATIDMNDCGSYTGAESDPKVAACRMKTPKGKRSDLADMAKRYSCVVHGGTTVVGAVQSEVDDTHVSMANLEASGIVWDAAYVTRGWIPDPTSSSSDLTSAYPDRDYYTGSMDGAQEWRKQNYCADTYSCKGRLGNIGGFNNDSGIECPNINQSDNIRDEDIFFWGRKN